MFVRKLPHPCIIRFVEMTVADKVSAMENLLEQEEETMRQGTIIVVTKSRVRMRQNQSPDRGDA